MFIITRRLGLAATLAIAIAIPATAGGEAVPQQPAPAAVSPNVDHRCPRGDNSVRDFTRYAARVYRRTTVSRAAHKRMAYMRKCQHSQWAERMVKRYSARYKREREVRRAEAAARAAILAVTPFSCSFGRSAIPCHIVQCESSGDWHVVNEIGALGFYQFLGKRIVWPVRTAADRLAHHRLAAALWADSHGHWAQCL